MEGGKEVKLQKIHLGDGGEFSLINLMLIRGRDGMSLDKRE